MGIPYFVGKISRSNFFFQGPGRLSEVMCYHGNGRTNKKWTKIDEIHKVPPCRERERVAWLHPGELTAGTQKWWFASDDVPFQLGDSFRFHLTLPKVNMEPKN